MCEGGSQVPLSLDSFIACESGPHLTPTSIKFNRFLKLILFEHKPLLACFGFVTSQKWLVSGEINLRKRLNLIDVGAELGAVHLSRHKWPGELVN